VLPGDSYVPTSYYLSLGAQQLILIQPKESGSSICFLRNAKGRALIFTTASDGRLVCKYFDNSDANPTDFTVDATAGCSLPTFDSLPGDLLEGTYLRGGVGKLARSFDLGRTWNVIDLSGSYTGQCSRFHRGRRVWCVFHDGAWYVKVGKLNADLTYTWSAEASMGLSSPSEKGSLREGPDDAALEFAYLDSGGAAHIATCRSLALDGTGSWS
jgi:hypothetical protein